MLVVCVIDRNQGGLEDSDEESVRARILAYKEVERAIERCVIFRYVWSLHWTYH